MGAKQKAELELLQMKFDHVTRDLEESRRINESQKKHAKEVCVLFGCWTFFLCWMEESVFDSDSTDDG